MSNTTDGFNKILNGLQIALYLLRFVFDHPGKTVLDSARGSTRAANSTKNFKFLSLEKALLAFFKSVVVHLTGGILRA